METIKNILNTHLEEDLYSLRAFGFQYPNAPFFRPILATMHEIKKMKATLQFKFATTKMGLLQIFLDWKFGKLEGILSY